MYGLIDKYKTRLMIKSYKQTEGLDYFDKNKFHKDDACNYCLKEP